MGRLFVIAAAGLLVLAVGLGGCVAVVAGGGTGTGVSAGAAAGQVSGAGGGGPAVPAAWELLEQQAAATCPGLPWTVLAAIGRVESDSGQSTAPGVHSGANSAGAEDIWRCGRASRDVRGRVVLARACHVSARCEARGPADGRYTASIGCRPYGGRVSGMAGGVAE